MGCLCVHERTSRYGGSRADSYTACHACGQGVESLSHLMFDCPATLLRGILCLMRFGLFCVMLLVALKKLRNVLSLTDASTKLLRFVSDDIWGSRGVCRVISRSVAKYLVQAWDVRNSCTHYGGVLPSLSAPEGCGTMALMLWLEWVT